MTAEAWRPDNYLEDRKAAINAEVVLASYEAISRQCELLIEHGFRLTQRLVSIDAMGFEAYDKLDEDEQQIKGLQLYVSPTMFEALWAGETPESGESDTREPQDALSIKLISMAVEDDEHAGDQLELIFPVQPDYEYPGPLADDDLPPSAFLKYTPNPRTAEPAIRYAIIRDGLSPGQPFRIYPYESAWDTGEDILHDDFSAKRAMYVLTHRMPDMAPVMARLFTSFGNFDATPQVDIRPSGKTEL